MDHPRPHNIEQQSRTQFEATLITETVYPDDKLTKSDMAENQLGR